MKIRIVVIFLLFPGALFAQVQPYASVVFGTYDMADMKSIQHDFIVQLAAQGIKGAKAEQAFTPSLQAEAGIDFGIGDGLSIGGFANYAITRGQVGYADYSGNLRINQDLSRIAAGGKVRALLTSNLDLYAKAGMGYSKLQFRSGGSVSSKTQVGSNLGFHSFAFILEPGIGWSLNIRRTFLRLSAGYEVNIPGNVFLDTDSKAYLTVENQKAKIDWTGFRGGFSVGWRLGEKK